MSIKDDFQEFYNYCYSHLKDTRQINDIKRIFYAGAFMALKATIECSELPEGKDVEGLDSLLEEVTAFLEDQKKRENF